MGNNITKPLSSLTQTNSKVFKKFLPIETFPNATLVDSLHATLFPHGQEALAVNCHSKVPPGWHVLCDLHALIDSEDRDENDVTICYQKLQLEQVLANLADIDQPEEMFSNLIESCNSSLLLPRSAKDLQTQLLKYALLVTCMYRVLEIGQEALEEAQSTIFYSIGHFLHELKILRIILEHWTTFVELYNNLLSTSSVLYDFLTRSGNKANNLKDAFRDFLTWNKEAEPAELEALTIKLEREADLLPFAQLALANSLLSISPDKALFLFNLVVPQIFVGEEEVQFYHQLIKKLPSELSISVMRYLILIDNEGEENSSIEMIKKLSLSDGGLIEQLAKYYIASGEAENAVYFVRKCKNLAKLVVNDNIDLVGVGLYDLLEPVIKELEAQGKWSYLAEICQARSDYRSTSKYLYLSYLESGERSHLLKSKENLKKARTVLAIFYSFEG